MYVFLSGGGEVALPDRLGPALGSRLWPADGGVRGRELVPETESELKLTKSA